jgi:hypothetical protein
VNRPLRATVIRFLVLPLAAILVGGCVTAKKGEGSKENAEHLAEKPTPLHPSRFLSSLLPTLEAAGDSCYVFLKPKKQSPYFGPLVKGEKIKWVDVHGNWVHVWIPRLLISGWVRRTQVYETNEKISSQENVPENLLSTLSVIVKRANIRKAPTRRSRIILVVRKNQEFWILNEKKGWYQVWIPDLKKKGWISGKIVSKAGKK